MTGERSVVWNGVNEREMIETLSGSQFLWHEPTEDGRYFIRVNESRSLWIDPGDRVTVSADGTVSA